jgi:uncharacterized protein (DUF1330 family)
MNNLNKDQARIIAIDFLSNFTKSDCSDSAEYARFCDHKKNFKMKGKLPSIKTIEQVMQKRGYEITFIKK